MTEYELVSIWISYCMIKTKLSKRFIDGSYCYKESKRTEISYEVSSNMFWIRECSKLRSKKEINFKRPEN